MELKRAQLWVLGALLGVPAFQELRDVQAKHYYLQEEGQAWKISKTSELNNLEDLRNICKYWGLAQVPFYVGGVPRECFPKLRTQRCFFFFF